MVVAVGHDVVEAGSPLEAMASAITRARELGWRALDRFVLDEVDADAFENEILLSPSVTAVAEAELPPKPAEVPGLMYFATYRGVHVYLGVGSTSRLVGG